MTDVDMVYHPPGDAARRLEVSPSGLRRYATFYEELYGELPKDTQGRRMWPREAVDRLEAAKAIMASGQVQSIKDALGALERGAQAPVEPLSVTVPRDTLGLLLEEVRTLRIRMEVVGRLETEVRELRGQLEAPRGDAVREAELEEQRRLNQYLLGELERRWLKDGRTPTRRPWWRLWRR